MNSETEIELKPCPFCWGEAELMTYYDLPQDMEIVACKRCGARGPEYIHDGEMLIVQRDLAAAAWNRRAKCEN